MQPIIKVENLSKKYRLGAVSHGLLFKDLQSAWARLRGKEDPNQRVFATGKRSPGSFMALEDVSFKVGQGDVVGIIGRNGAGKSTLLKILSRVTTPSTGKISLRGRVASLLEVGTGFHPELTGRENIFLNGAILGMTKAEISRKFDTIVDFAEIETFIDTPVKRYSSGMYVRLAFAVAAHLEPEILIVDEVLAVGDIAFQKKCLGKIGDISKEGGRTILFVSHNMEAVRSICSRTILLRNGKVNHDGDVDQGVAKYFEVVTNIDETTSAHDTTYRRSNGPLRVKRFSVTQGENAAMKVDYISPEKPFTITIEYVTTGPVKGVCFALYLKAREGGNLIARINGILTDSHVAANTVGSGSIEVEKLDLPSGIFPLYLNLSDLDGYLSDIPAVYDVLDELLPPLIMRGSGDKSEGFVKVNYTISHSETGIAHG